MHAKIVPPKGDKSWSLQFFDVEFGTYLYPGSELIEDLVISRCMSVGRAYNVRPFVQGKGDRWIMIELWTDDESQILKFSLKVCELLQIIELDIE